MLLLLIPKALAVTKGEVNRGVLSPGDPEKGEEEGSDGVNKSDTSAPTLRDVRTSTAEAELCGRRNTSLSPAKELESSTTPDVLREPW